MGRRRVTDLLAVSLSSTDSIGHLFGPHSQEIQDLMLRLDRMLGDFFRFLDGRIGLEHVVIVLTADHGVAPLPETPNSDGVTGRQNDGAAAAVRRAEALLVQELGPGPWIEQQYGDNIYLNQDTLRSRGLSSSEVEDRLARILRESPQVSDVFTRTELVSGQPHQTPYSSLYANCFNPQNSGDVVLQPQPGILYREGSGTTHGTPYSYDTHVPLVVSGPGITPGVVGIPVRTVDIGPTLAGLLKVPIPEKVDGRDILQK
jgi:arylsulfatase A-like enzyme